MCIQEAKSCSIWIVFLMMLNCNVAAQPIVILNANESPPYWTQSSVEGGLGAELIQAISEVAGLETRIKFAPLQRMIDDDSNNDLGNPEFYLPKQEFAAVIPIAVSQIALFYYRPHHSTRFDFKSIEELKPYKIGVLKGTLIDRHAFEQMGIHFESSYAQASLFKKLKLGRLDLVFEIDLVGQQIINKVYPDQIANFAREPLPNSSSPIAIMLDAHVPDVQTIAARYRAGLAHIIQSGRYQQIVRKYYPDAQIPEHWFEELQHFQKMYAFDL